MLLVLLLGAPGLLAPGLPAGFRGVARAYGSWFAGAEVAARRLFHYAVSFF